MPVPDFAARLAKGATSRWMPHLLVGSLLIAALAAGEAALIVDERPLADQVLVAAAVVCAITIGIALAALLRLDIRRRFVPRTEFDTFTGCASDWVWRMDESLRFTWFSGRLATSSGVLVSTFVGKTRADVILPEDRDDPKVMAHLQDLEHRRPFRDFTYRTRRDDGTVRFFEVSGDPVFEDDGHFRGYCGVGRDVTDRILAEQKKLAALAGLVSGVAHELNTPLGTAITAAALAEEQLREVETRFRAEELAAEDLTEFLSASSRSIALIRTGVGRAAGLVEAFKRVSANPGDMERDQFPVIQEIGGLAETMRSAIEARGITLSLDLQGEAIMDGYSEVLRQVIRDLIDNAMDHAFTGREPGTITLCASVGDGRLQLSVSDNGVGIEPGLLPRLFEPFLTSRRGAGHAGLGLHVVHNLTAWVLGGQVSLKSQPGLGTSAHLSLPLVAPEGRNSPLAVETKDAAMAEV